MTKIIVPWEAVPTQTFVKVEYVNVYTVKNWTKSI